MLSKIDSFHAGAIQNHLPQWRMITQELETLETASGMKMEFSAPLGHHLASKKTFSDVEQRFIQQEIRNLLKKGVLVQSNHEIGEFISPIFLVPKDENEFRTFESCRRQDRTCLRK